MNTNQKLPSLNSTHQLIVEGFVEEAKREAQRILVNKSLGAAPFSDTIFREMATQFPVNEQQLARIKGIQAYQIKQYGKVFIKMIKQAKRQYEEMMLQSEERVRD